ncbi:hypothetical protein [Pseudobdellovibrio sp. HCB154]|uniref:hypothetical protein n=1 Tax=Pseudobdellovibrio sp. HCB154 TaxID=3386277 RepID=UPI0039170A17
MNTVTKISTSLILIVMAGIAKAENLPAKDVVVPINEAFVPGGFDSQSDSFVVVSGIFPNGCYRWKNAEVKNVSEFVHEVTSHALVNQGMCIMVLVPFSKDVRLGRLQSGTHALRFLNGDGTYMEKTLTVE